MPSRTKINKLATVAILTSIAIALQIIEAMIPIPVNIPGGKIGLANIATLICMVMLDYKSAFAVAIMRSCIASLLYGGVSAMIYSISGALFSAVVMMLLLKYAMNKLSLVGVSIAGAAAHCTAQVTVAAVLLSNVLVFTYLPLLVLISVITGIATGYTAKYCCSYLKAVDKK